ncbi:hypothetical protein NE619_11355 [Anaerovorax odorimutans]|uniref:Uncharacterized protein n=1 Tax=Anaerovorax odorimutans TaxID=109327 RepID=A0ABT1RQ80_9FIRM|nr:hypothetical protein [Anaerovorax odorimutans]MCQ4637321.1 hypothetical protein [Anaerovorax odorimutans]
MREKLMTAVCGILMVFPWTLLVLRTNEWALLSPAAERLIALYAVVMIGGGILTGIAYGKTMLRNSFMKLCLVVNMLYAACGAAALVMMTV